MVGGSARHEELYSRIIALGKLRTAVLEFAFSIDFCEAGYLSVA